MRTLRTYPQSQVGGQSWRIAILPWRRFAKSNQPPVSRIFVRDLTAAIKAGGLLRLAKFDYAGACSSIPANPIETTFIGALSGSAPSTANSQRVRPENSSSFFMKPSLE